MWRARLTTMLVILSSAVTSAFAAGPPAKTHSEKPSNAASAGVPGGFGRAVAIIGDEAFVGEPGGARGSSEPGVVHIYQKSATGWKQSGTLTSPTGAPGDGFGAALALSGTTLLVSQTPQIPALRNPNAPAPQLGPEIIHVYKRAADGRWAATGTLASPFGSGSEFGSALALSGDVALVGAPLEAGGGAVVAFRRGANGSWTSAGNLPMQGLVAGDRFGAALSIDGNRAAVGAPGREHQGAVFVFNRDADGAWSADGASLAGRRSPENSEFGSSVLLKGAKLLVGAPGAVFVAATPPGTPAPVVTPPPANARRFQGGMGVIVEFARNAAGNWVEGGTIAPYDFPTAARLGTSLGMSGEEVWSGAPMSDGSGRIYRLAADKTGAFKGMTKLMVNDAAPVQQFGGPAFGTAFAVSGNNAMVGMPGDAGGLGTVMFLSRTPPGDWVVRSTVFPPVPDRFPEVVGKEVKCDAQGMASSFPCSNTGLLAFLPIQKIGGTRASHMNDNWGWTDPTTKREYALAGRTDGTSFVDITDPEHPRYLGDLPKTPGVPSGVWRDIKTYKNYAYIVADGSGAHGMQVFNLAKLRNVKTPQIFKPDTTYHEINSAHNIVINEESGYAYVVGASAGGTTCGGGLHMVDIRDPIHPKFAGCFADERTGRRKTGYSHDAQCVTYHGPDTRYSGHEICVGSNETAVSFADVTNKKSPKALSFISYPNVAYAHQGWFTEDQRFFYLDDEADEIAAMRDTTGTNMAGKGTRTMIYDVAKLDDPVLAKEYIGPVKSSDHNLYVRGHKLYEANYGSGLRIIDIADPLNPHEVGYLDTYPDDKNEPVMHGAWSNYPFFPSGTILVTSVSEGMFLVKDRSQPVVP